MTQYEKETLQCLINIEAQRRKASISRAITADAGVDPYLLKMDKRDRDVILFGVGK